MKQKILAGLATAGIVTALVFVGAAEANAKTTVPVPNPTAPIVTPDEAHSLLPSPYGTGTVWGGTPWTP